MVSLSFLLASVLILLTPGPTNTVLAACGAAMGFRKSVFLPAAETLGYLISVSVFAYFSSHIHGNVMAAGSIKLVAAAWLSYSAWRLWSAPLDMAGSAPVGSFLRVLFTTMVNPKAMLVGTVLIPADSDGGGPWIAAFAALAAVAGLGWVLIGAAMPLGIRRHAYRLAAIVLSGFSVVSVASAIG